MYDTFWRFAVERQKSFFRRLQGTSPQWSTDHIIQAYRFTNVYRASDRVSQYLIQRVQYTGDQDPMELFFRTILFKLFNRIETWQLLEEAFGHLIASEFDPGRYSQVLDEARKAGKRIYSAAYIMPPAPGGRPGTPKHVGHLELLQTMLRNELPRRLAESSSLNRIFALLRSYPMMGDFLAYQYTIDLNYSTLLDFSEMDFVVPGPGARGGIRKCFSDCAGLSGAEVIRFVVESQLEEFSRRDLSFPDLWGRPLQLIDVQNLFCEVDKYARVAYPELNNGGVRTRIKQKFHPTGPLPVPWFPPKWRLNERIGHDPEGRSCI